MGVGAKYVSTPSVNHSYLLINLRFPRFRLILRVYSLPYIIETMQVIIEFLVFSSLLNLFMLLKANDVSFYGVSFVVDAPITVVRSRTRRARYT